jgi:hypothetical protein
LMQHLTNQAGHHHHDEADGEEEHQDGEKK